MSKVIGISEEVANSLKKLKDEYEEKTDDNLSYSKAVRKALRKAGFWYPAWPEKSSKDSKPKKSKKE